MSSDDEFVMVDSGSETDPVPDTVDSLPEAVDSGSGVDSGVDTTIAEPDEKIQDSNERTYEEFVHDQTPVKTYRVNGVNYLLHNSVPNDTVKSMMRKHWQCVECVSRVSKFSRLFGPVAKGSGENGSKENGSVFLRNIRCKTDGGCPDGCLFNIRKEIEKMNGSENKNTLVAPRPFIVKEGCFPNVAKGEDEDGNKYEHPTITPDEYTPNDKVLAYQGLIKKYFRLMVPRIEKLCNPEAVTAVSLILKRINELERTGHWLSVFKWVQYVQNFAKNRGSQYFTHMSEKNKAHVIMVAITSGRNEVNNESGSYVHLDYQQSSNITDFIQMETVDDILKEMDRRTSPETYQVRRVVDILEEHNVSSDMTITLTWNDSDDLDLHVQPIEPFLPEIYYGRRRVSAPDGSVFTLDFDMNAQRVVENPCENVSVGPGTFKIMVNNYRRRGLTRPVPFSVVIREKGQPDIEINEVWATDRNTMNKMTIKTHTFGSPTKRPIEMTTKESNRAKALDSKWIEYFGEPTSEVPVIGPWCIFHTWTKKKSLSPTAPVFTPSSNISFMDLANATPKKKKSLAETEAERIPTNLTDLLTWLKEGSHRVTINPRNFTPGYVTRLDAKSDVFKETYVQHHYQNKFKLPVDPMTCNEASNARFNESWFKDSYVPSNVEIELICDMGLTKNHFGKNSWFMVLKDVTLPINDTDFPIASGFRPTNLKAEFHDLRDRWAYNNTQVKPTLEEGVTPAIGTFITSDTVNLVVDGKKVCINI
uniref:Uncharacterized protein n=1 Tax=viral metagenome TaxID=1070528 RepID=A0A6C0CE05_9ZZZZ